MPTSPPKPPPSRLTFAKVRIYTLLVVLAVTGYIALFNPELIGNIVTGPAREVQAVDLPLAPEILDINADEMFSAYPDQYRLKPDRRFLQAIGKIHFLISGKPEQPADARFKNNEWEISYQNEIVGSCPEFPDFHELIKLLLDWSQTTLKHHPEFSVPGPPLPEQEKNRIADLTNSFQAMDAATALLDINHHWMSGIDKKILLHFSAEAWSILTFLSHDTLEIADALPAQALAVLALAKHLGGSSFYKEEFLLSEWMGYSTHSDNLAKKFDPSDPLRLYINHQDIKLKLLAESNSATRESQVLWIFRLAEEKKIVEWEKWMTRFEDKQTSSFASAKSGLILNAFSGNRSIAKWARAMVIYQLDQESLKNPNTNPVSEFMDNLWKKSETLQAVSSVLDMTRDYRDLGTLESKLEALDYIEGPILNSQAFRGYFRGIFYSALHLEGKHFLYRLSSIESSEFFLDSLGTKQDGNISWLQGWLIEKRKNANQEQPNASSLDVWLAEQAPDERGLLLARGFYLLFKKLIEIERNNVQPNEIVQELFYLRAMGGASHIQLLDKSYERVNNFYPGIHYLVKLSAAMMDSRLYHRNSFRKYVRFLLQDQALVERLSTSVFKAGFRKFPYYQGWYLNFMGDTRGLFKLLHTKNSPIDTRIWILDFLNNFEKVKTRTLIREYEKLLKENPDYWYLRRKFYFFLRDHNEYEKSRRIISDWMKRDVPVAGLEKVVSQNFIAESFYNQKKYQQAFQAIAPVVQSYHGGSLRMGGQILNRLGKKDDAEKLFRAAVNRYPNHFESILELTKFLWDSGKYQEAAKIILEFPLGLGSSHWANQIAPAFVEIFESKPEEEALAAFEEFIKGKAIVDLLEYIPGDFYRRDRSLLAFKLQNKLTAKGSRQLGLKMNAYTYLKASRGEKKAIKWLKEQKPEGYGEHTANVLFSKREYDLLWKLVPEPDPQAWALRAAGSLVSKPTRQQRKQLLDHFKTNQRSDLRNQIGRYLLGKIPLKELLRHGQSATRKLEIAFFIGWKYEANGDLYSASRWYRIAMETRERYHWEYRWAVNRLGRWTKMGRSLSYIKSHPL